MAARAGRRRRAGGVCVCVCAAAVYVPTPVSLFRSLRGVPAQQLLAAATAAALMSGGASLALCHVTLATTADRKSVV